MYCLSCTVYIYIPRASVLTKKESIICVQYCLFSLIKASKPMEVFGQDNIYIYMYILMTVAFHDVVVVEIIIIVWVKFAGSTLHFFWGRLSKPWLLGRWRF